MPINYALLAIAAVIVIVIIILFFGLLMLTTGCGESCTGDEMGCADCPECSTLCNDCCNSYAESCAAGANCDTGCSESCEGCGAGTVGCNESCTSCDASSSSCNPCGDSCSSSSMSSSCCSTTSFPEVIALVGTLISTFIGVILVGLLQNFDSQSPILIIICGSVFLSFSLSGIRFDNPDIEDRKYKCKSLKNAFSKERVTKFWRFNIVHSHHSEEQRGMNHELRIGNKYFCTGCYGTLLGTIISILLIISYFYFGTEKTLIPIIALLIPMCFIPIILKYTIFTRMKPAYRLISNALLPIGFCTLVILLDVTYQSWLINALLILLVIIVAYTRAIVARVDNNKTSTLIEK